MSMKPESVSAEKWLYLWRAIDLNGQIVDFLLTAQHSTAECEGGQILSQQGDRPCPHVSAFHDLYRQGACLSSRHSRDQPPLRRTFRLHTTRRPKLAQQSDLKRSCCHEAAGRNRQSFRSLQTARATFNPIDAIRTIKREQIHDKQPSVVGEIAFVDGLVEAAV